MNLKHVSCKIEGCLNKHKGKGYCQNHLEKYKRGTLEVYPHSKLCEVQKCFGKSYCHDKCIKHYQRDKKGLPVNLPFNTKNEYLRGNLDFIHSDHRSWPHAVKQCFGKSCMICGWNKAACEAHHILPKSEGGLNSLQNAIVLCPNCHTEAHAGLITKEQLQEYNNKAIKTLTMVEPLEE